MTTGCRYSNSVMVSLNSRKSHNTVESATTDYESYSMRFQTRNTYQETTFGAVRFFRAIFGAAPPGPHRHLSGANVRLTRAPFDLTGFRDGGLQLEVRRALAAEWNFSARLGRILRACKTGGTECGGRESDLGSFWRHSATRSMSGRCAVRWLFLALRRR